MGKQSFPEGFAYNEFFEKLSSYVEVMHTEKGIAHLDLKPANILIDRKTCLPFLIDFGEAQSIDPRAAKNQEDPKADRGHRMLDD